MMRFPRLLSSEKSSVENRRISEETAEIVTQILDHQLPSVMKTLSPRRITGFNSHNGYTVPRLEHVKDDRYDQYTIGKVDEIKSDDADSGSTTQPSYKQYKLKSPEYICFINHSGPEIAEKSLTSLPSWRRHKRRAPPSRVKSMDELMLEESVRRYSRSLTRVPDLRVKGSYAPGYQCKWERFKHLPDIKPVTNSFERQPSSADAVGEYQDADASFSQTRVDEILKSEGFITPGSGINQLRAGTCSASPGHLNHILLDDDFFKGRLPVQYYNHHSKRPDSRMFSISASRIDPQLKTSKVARSPVHSGESLAILQMKKRLPNLIVDLSAGHKPD